MWLHCGAMMEEQSENARYGWNDCVCLNVHVIKLKDAK